MGAEIGEARERIGLGGDIRGRVVVASARARVPWHSSFSTRDGDHSAGVAAHTNNSREPARSPLPAAGKHVRCGFNCGSNCAMPLTPEKCHSTKSLPDSQRPARVPRQALSPSERS